MTDDQVRLKLMTKNIINESNPNRLINEEFITNDTEKIWKIKKLANYLPKIIIEFEEITKLSMIRIWN